MWLVDRWRSFDPSWKFAIGAYLVARVALSVWATFIVLLFPVLVKNLDLFGVPVLGYFDLVEGQRYAYSRQVDQTILSFRAGDNGFVTDYQTASVWALRDGRAVSGEYSGRSLATTSYSVEDIFPYRGIPSNQNILLSAWQRFDTNWYLKIAQQGYAADDGSTVYFPLYPALIRVASFLIGDSLLAALFVSNLAAIGALALLYRLSRELFPSTDARRTIVYWLLFPTAFFLLAAYTEALFLFLTLGAFVAARQSRWVVAALFGAFAAFTRLQGVLLIVPLAYMLWRDWRNAQHVTRSTYHASHITHYVLRFTALLAIPFATLVFLAFTNLSLIASYEGELHARFVMPWDNVLASVALLTSGQGSPIDALNLVATIGFGIMLFVVWKTRSVPLEYSLYSIAMFFAPLLRMTTTQPLVSMDRYVLVMFPIFMLWGVWGKNSWVNRAVVYLSFPLQLYLSAQFILWGWVG
ncbi:MAG: glycosyltransferase family 39 protein [Chloroflexi bacterium]|nr:glycosyltransferase family 39 protein [Chloroflexota bacterium]